MLAILRILYIGLLSVMLSATVFIYYVDYTAFSDIILALAGREEMRSYWETKLLPAARFDWLRLGLLVLSGLLLLTLFWAWRGLAGWAKNLNIGRRLVGEELAAFRTKIHEAKAWERWTFWGVLGLLALRGLWNISFYALQYDEAWTYNNFVHNGLLISALSPHNNHILYTELAALLDFLPISGKWMLRLPVFGFGLAVWLLWLWGWRRYLSWRDSFLQSIGLLIAPTFMMYAMYGRGYMLAICFGLLHLWALSGLLEGKGRRWVWLLALARVLGTYSLPTYIYIWLAAELAYVLAGGRAVWRGWLLSGLILVGLYAPFLLTNGMGILSGAAAAEYSWADHWRLFHKLADWMLFGADFVGLGYFSLFLAVGAMWRGRKASGQVRIWYFFSGFLLIMPLFAFFYQPLRVWSVQLLAYSFLFGRISLWLFALLFRSPIKKPFIISIILFILVGQWQAYRHYEINWSAGIDKTAEHLGELLAAHRIEELYTFSRYDKPLLEYYHLRRTGRRLKTYMPYKESVDYQAFEAGVYAAVLLDIEDYQPTAADWQRLSRGDYELIYSDWRLRLYLAK